jgi:peptidoglycan/LPS O-acetylase OafA/YrhL
MSGSGKVMYLDGIRGMAALCVFFHHFTLAFYPAYYTHVAAQTHLNGLELAYGESVFRFLTCGSFCVHIFFILSGYVLSRKYMRENDLNIIVSSAQKRYLRLFIPVGTTLVIAYLLMVGGLYYNRSVAAITYSHEWLGDFWTFANPTIVFLKSFFYQTMFHGQNLLDTTLWTMSIELYGSMLVFALLALTHNTRSKGLSFVLMGIALILMNKTLYTCFVLGISFNYLERNPPKMNPAVRFAVTTFLLVVGCILGSYSQHVNTGSIFDKLPATFMAARNTFHIAGGYFVILSVVLSPRLQSFFSTTALRFLGHISFSLYLLHCLIIGSFSCYIFLKLYEPLGYNAAVGIVFVLTTVLVFVLSHLMANHVDLKGVALAGKYYNRLFRQKNTH